MISLPTIKYPSLFIAFAFTLSAQAEDTKNSSSIQTTIHDNKAAKLLQGEHFFSLHWISWKHYGKASIIKNDNGQWTLKGSQKSKKNDDFVTIDGVIKEINEKNFVFNGTIVTQVSFLNDGKPMTRSGDMNFLIKGSRKYWRLQEMKHENSNTVDYIDIFFLKYPSKQK